ncbi:hypothetical protein L2E82_47091 [Cichorium intybus]|uniref:Uncharacterized protein n=1 Tax=Cichorium intybus TaxID=13427 RepID=A0ACB8YV44_CICIN|nr:hypothetical protein L2E82_47091 [Cichorium intybus]
MLGIPLCSCSSISFCKKVGLQMILYLDKGNESYKEFHANVADQGNGGVDLEEPHECKHVDESKIDGKFIVNSDEGDGDKKYQSWANLVEKEGVDFAFTSACGKSGGLISA